MVYQSGPSKHHQCISLLQKPTALFPTEAKLCNAFKSYRGGGGGVSLCVCKAVKRGAEEAASFTAKSALLVPCETTSVEDVCAAHLHTEMAFGKRIALSRLET
ncbi:hypothetical protein GOODEAATRI_034369 [Goodea atripinnis]|uniref:Uncharacterized protein n=1 Tax=Goodea atripinnis TaxID=208336 RepID=A0ABV0Q460_9TELE